MLIKRGVGFIACAVLALSALAGCGTGGAANNVTNTSATNTTSGVVPPDRTYTGKTVATYAGGDVKKDELDTLYGLLVGLPGYQSQESKSDFLTYYIVWYKYIYGIASKDKSVKIDVGQAKQVADKSIQDLVGQKYKTKADALKAIQQLGASEDDLIALAVKGQYIRSYVQGQMKDLKASDADVQNYYNQHKDEFTTVTVSHVLVNSLADAKKVEAELKGGADFAKTADKYSTDPGVKQNHGTYADTPANTFVPEFAKACLTLPIGQISDPVKSQFGYHIIRVEKRTVKPLDQVKAQIQQEVLQSVQQQKETQIYDDAKKKANMKVLVKASEL